MAPKYDMSKASDRNRFAQDLKKAAMENAKEQEITVNCPKCGKKIQIHNGENFCPFCESQINLHLEF